LALARDISQNKSLTIRFLDRTIHPFLIFKQCSSNTLERKEQVQQQKHYEVFTSSLVPEAKTLHEYFGQL